MLNGGRAHLLDAPHLTIFPGVLAIVVLGFNFLGDGLRDAIDPTPHSEPEAIRPDEPRQPAFTRRKSSLELLERAIVGLGGRGLRRRPDARAATSPALAAPRRPAVQQQRGARAGFVDRAIEPAHRERRLAEPHRQVRDPRRDGARAACHRRPAWRTSRARRARPGCGRHAPVTSASCRYASGGTGRCATAWRSARSAACESPASSQRAAQFGEACRCVASERPAACCSASTAFFSATRSPRRLRRRQPDVAERGVGLRRVGKALDGAAQRDHRGILAPGARLRQADRHQRDRRATARAPPAPRAARSPWRSRLRAR